MCLFQTFFFSAKDKDVESIHDPMDKILLRDFHSNCVILSYFIYQKKENNRLFFIFVTINIIIMLVSLKILRPYSKNKLELN